ncbi:MAG: hydrogen gas-evolving membrane-bound hydrogenase subunit E, partial [Spirochaetota bacterium]
SVISFGAVGIGLSISFLLLSAPDLAIVQISVEVLFLIFFIRATISREVIPAKGHIQWGGFIVVLLLLIGFFIFGLFAFQSLTSFGIPLFSLIKDVPTNEYLAGGLKETGSANIVTSIILDYRAYDTLGEATVLFTAIIGALTILRGKARSKGDSKKGDSNK